MRALKFVASPLIGGLGLISSPGKPPKPLPSARRDDATVTREMLDDLSRRRGGAADMLTGSTGAEAPQATGKTVLGQ